MSIVGSEQWMYNSSTGFYPFDIDQSCRFNDASNDFLSRTFEAGNQKTFTYSCWVKLSALSTSRTLLAQHTSGSNTFVFRFDGSNNLQVENFVSSYQLHLVTDAEFRDIGAWYNVVLRIDTTQSTDTDRARLYVNGTEQTSFSSSVYPSQNADLKVNAAASHIIGARSSGSFNFDGYLADVNFIDGLSLAPTSFGELKEDIWVPIDTSDLNFASGANSFRLQFQDSSSLGDDTGGQTHDFSVTGLTSADQMSDSPTNNHPVLGAQPIVTHTLSDGNLKSTNSSGTHGGTTATFNYPTSGKWYHEVTINAETSDKGQGVGIGNQISRTATNWGNYLNIIAYLSDGTKLVDTGYASYGTAHDADDVVGVAYNADDQELEFYLNGTGQGTIATSEMDGLVDFNNLCPLVFGRNMGQTFNFGQSSFAHTPPSGYNALNTANLSDPAIDPAAGETPDQYFDTTTYTANNGTLTITGLQFQPDFVWIKSRSLDIAHAWFDALRGTATAGSTNTAIGSNRNDAEGNGNGVLSAFTSDGFTVAGGSSGSNPRNLVNKGTNTYVAWTWKAGGAPSADNSAGVGATPTAGSVKIDGANLGSALAGTLAATRLSANTEAGFSIVTFEAPSTGGKTIAHGLSSPPEMLIFKSRSNATGWIIQHVGTAVSDPFTDFIAFSTSAASDNATVSNDTAPTSSVFTIGSGFTSGNYGTNQVAYCFHSVDGFSKFGSYVGNGSVDGTFVHTGFRVAWLMVKRSDGGSENWNIVDNKRNSFNGAKSLLFASASSVEANATNGIDLLSNGFKVRDNIGNYNTSSANYLYMAFADQPLKYSNAR